MSTSQIAQGLASLGRGGDSVLVHMQPQEVQGLEAIAKASGTQLTTNPYTGMPEAFNLGGFFKNLLPTIAGFGAAGLSGGAMSPMLAGILAGSVTGAVTNKKDPLMGAVMGGIGGYGGSNLLTAAKGMTAATPAAMPTSGVEQAVNQSGGIMSDLAMNPSLPQTGITGARGELGANMGLVNPPVSSALPNPGQMTSALTEQALPQNGLQQAVSNIGANPFEFVNQNAKAIAMPVGMAALSSLDTAPQGMSQEEFEAEQRRKFNRPLNLNQDTGLRLANGGSVQGGGVMDLYQSNDTQPMFGGSQGFGLGRLNNLAQQQSMARAEAGSFAAGGVPKLEDGGFVVPADVTFYLGDHNTEAGQQRLAEMFGGVPIRGPGTGLSDSIPTSIEGREPARVATGEVYIPRQVVAANGGPETFYKMMAQIRKNATGSTKQAKSA